MSHLGVPREHSRLARDGCQPAVPRFPQLRLATVIHFPLCLAPRGRRPGLGGEERFGGEWRGNKMRQP